MRCFSLLFSLLVFATFANAQKTYFLKASGGRVLFGTGDVGGFGVGVELSSPLSQQKKTCWQHFQVGAEANFENGVIQPVVLNPTGVEFFHNIFSHVSNTTIYPKLTYYPLSYTFLKGLNVAIGPSAGYTFQSTESSASTQVLGEGTVLRESLLGYHNAWVIGFRISAGYEYLIANKILAGSRIDFANYQNHDVNTLAAFKLGMKL